MSSIKKQSESSFEVGQFINKIRIGKCLSIQQLSVHVGISPTYLREVERGLRVPDDKFIRNLAKYCGCDENYIYHCMGKSPLIAREELEQNNILQETLKEIALARFPEQKKNEIYKLFYSMAKLALLTAK
ncbi:helix-turn-helix domain-containing protein [Desulfitobacterium sp. AusDCA]|uniref:helix-turn-helix domain-containing protein n=1 Tax=Desulfitobacterium sp. AusDCA TaxID=3240383 RepID=UPI003DA70347